MYGSGSQCKRRKFSSFRCFSRVFIRCRAKRRVDKNFVYHFRARYRIRISSSSSSSSFFFAGTFPLSPAPFKVVVFSQSFAEKFRFSTAERINKVFSQFEFFFSIEKFFSDFFQFFFITRVFYSHQLQFVNFHEFCTLYLWFVFFVVFFGFLYLFDLFV